LPASPMHFRPAHKIGQKTVLSLVVFSLIFLLIIRSTDYPAAPTVQQIKGVKSGHGGSAYPVSRLSDSLRQANMITQNGTSLNHGSITTKHHQSAKRLTSSTSQTLQNALSISPS